MADRNSTGVVFNCSDCGDDYVRMYRLDGDDSGSECGTWGLSPEQIKYIHCNPDVNHTFESITHCKHLNK